jgi:gamma-glutamylcyclotransferase (GGCT)/AIG2-like uncharacterized protein YtfP
MTRRVGRMSGAPETERKRDEEHELLFVYGTLMRDGRLHHLLGGSPGVEFAGEAKIRAKLYIPKGEDYPGADLTSATNEYVFGELYTLREPEDLLNRLDVAEGCDEGLFIRRRVDTFQAGKKKKAWTYIYARSLAGAERVPGGKYQIVRSPT